MVKRQLKERNKIRYKAHNNRREVHIRLGNHIGAIGRKEEKKQRRKRRKNEKNRKLRSGNG